MKFIKKSEIEATTYEEFVQFGKENESCEIDGEIVDFVFKGLPVKDNKDGTFLVGGVPFSKEYVIAEIEGKQLMFEREAWFGIYECADFNEHPPVAQTKIARMEVKHLVDKLNKSLRTSRSRSLAIIKLEEASMWLGKDLQELNEEYPYPNSFDPKSKVIDPSSPEACNIHKKS